jgi:hypothetical protein
MKFVSFARAHVGKFAAGVGGMVLAGSAMAQTSDTDGLVTAVTTELSGGKAAVYAIGAVIISIVAAVALIRHLRAASH